MAVPTNAVVSITADNEASYSLPARTKRIIFQCRDDYDIRYAWVTGKVATPTDPYMTLKSGSVYNSYGMDFATGEKLYLSCANNTTVEIEVL